MAFSAGSTARLSNLRTPEPLGLALARWRCPSDDRHPVLRPACTTHRPAPPCSKDQDLRTTSLTSTPPERAAHVCGQECRHSAGTNAVNRQDAEPLQGPPSRPACRRKPRRPYRPKPCPQTKSPPEAGFLVHSPPRLSGLGPQGGGGVQITWLRVQQLAWQRRQQRQRLAWRHQQQRQRRGQQRQQQERREQQRQRQEQQERELPQQERREQQELLPSCRKQPEQQQRSR